MEIIEQLRLRLLFVFALTCNVHTQTVGYDTFVSQTLLDLCPFTDSCTQPSKLEFKYNQKKYMPCCAPCSCGEDCKIKGTCCHDAKTTNFTEILSERTGVRCISSTYRPGVNKVDGYKFYVVTMCPDKYPHQDTTQLCQTANPKQFDQLLFVSDDEGNIYRNRFCANCNGVLKFSPWVLTFECNNCNTSRDGLFEPTMKYVKQYNFLLRSNVPTNIPFPIKHMCEEPYFNTCNITGTLIDYDPFIDKACNDGPNITYFWIYPTLIRFKNIFCFLCNNEDVAIQNVCPILDDNKRMNSQSYSFTAILYLNSLTNSIGNYESQCKGNEIHDKIFDVCRKLICPLHTFATSGTCKKSFDVSVGLCVQFSIVLQTPEPYPISKSESQLISEKIAQEIYYHIGFDKSFCGFCRTLSWQQPMVNTTFIANVNLATTFKCSVSDILEITSDLNKSMFKVNFNKRTLNFTLHIQTEPTEASELTIPYLESLGLGVAFNSEHICDTAVSLAEFKCPRVLISGLDYVKAVGRQHVEDTYYFKTHDLGVYDDNELALKTFEICLDDYFGKLKSHTTRSVYVSVHILLYTLSVYQFSLHIMTRY